MFRYMYLIQYTNVQILRAKGVVSFDDGTDDLNKLNHKIVCNWSSKWSTLYSKIGQIL